MNKKTTQNIQNNIFLSLSDFIKFKKEINQQINSIQKENKI